MIESIVSQVQRVEFYGGKERSKNLQTGHNASLGQFAVSANPFAFGVKIGMPTRETMIKQTMMTTKTRPREIHSLNTSNTSLGANCSYFKA